MKAISNVAKFFLVAGLFGLALSGCERRTDDTAAGSSGTSGETYGQSGSGTSGAGTSSGTANQGTGSSSGQYDKNPPAAGTGSSK